VFDLVGADLKSAAPFDGNGRLVELGDWIRVVQAPLSIIGMPRESLLAFSRAIGHTFQVSSIMVNGDLELDMFPKISFDSIWIEPSCCVVTKRPAKHSRTFQQQLDKTLTHDQEHGRPQYRAQP
jgi:hypothetical protein